MKSFELLSLILVGLCVILYATMALAGEKVHAGIVFIWVMTVFFVHLSEYLKK